MYWSITITVKLFDKLENQKEYKRVANIDTTPPSFDNIRSIVTKIDDNLYKVEVYGYEKEDTLTIKVNGNIVPLVNSSFETQEDIYAAVDTIIDKIERQIRKNKTKLESQAKKSREVKGFVLDEIIEVEEDEVEETKIVKRKKVDVKPMSEEEAVLQMELLGHDFYLFKDADTMKPALVYKRKDNQYGIIETE